MLFTLQKQWEDKIMLRVVYERGIVLLFLFCFSVIKTNIVFKLKFHRLT